MADESLACGEVAVEPEGEEAVEELMEGAELMDEVLTESEGSTCVEDASGCEAESVLLSALSTAGVSEDVDEEAADDVDD